MAMDADTRQIILDTAAKIFADHCDKSLLDEAERGTFADGLWQLVVENGFHQLGSAESGTGAEEMFAFLQVCGRFAVPLPMAETLLVNAWCGAADSIASIGVLTNDVVTGAAWVSRATRLVGVPRGMPDVRFATDFNVMDESTNLAGEPVADATLGEAEYVEVVNDPYSQMALSRINLMAGSLQAQLELAIQFATERVQFGRSISKFQAIQHSLAVVAAEVAAAKRAADAAVDALDDPRFISEVAAGKARVGEAVGIVAEQVHQIHGAMGFTYEHRLHHFSRRAWAWRDSWGNEFYWQALLGNHLAQLGAEDVWDFIATRG